MVFGERNRNEGGEGGLLGGHDGTVGGGEVRTWKVKSEESLESGELWLSVKLHPCYSNFADVDSGTHTKIASITTRKGAIL